MNAAAFPNLHVVVPSGVLPYSYLFACTRTKRIVEVVTSRPPSAALSIALSQLNYPSDATDALVTVKASDPKYRHRMYRCEWTTIIVNPTEQ